MLGVLVVDQHRRPGPGLLGAVVKSRGMPPVSWSWPNSAPPGPAGPRQCSRCGADQPHFVTTTLNTIASFVAPTRTALANSSSTSPTSRYSFRAAASTRCWPTSLRTSTATSPGRASSVSAGRQRCRSRRRCSTMSGAVPGPTTPLVENAVRHGPAGRRSGNVTLIARDEGADCVISVEGRRRREWIPRHCARRADALNTDSGDQTRTYRADQCRSSAAGGVRQRLQSGCRNRSGAGTKVVMRGAQSSVRVCAVTRLLDVLARRRQNLRSTS